MADIVTLILQDILKISTDLLYKYSSMTDQLIYLILIPSVIVLLFVWMFGIWISPHHPKFALLISIVSYIFIVYSGWYGSFFVPIIIDWFMILLALGFVFFIVTRIVSPRRGEALGKFAEASAKLIKQTTVGKSKKEETLLEEIESLHHKETELTNKKNQAEADGNPKLANYYQLQLEEVQNMIRKRESQLQEL